MWTCPTRAPWLITIFITLPKAAFTAIGWDKFGHNLPSVSVGIQHMDKGQMLNTVAGEFNLPSAHHRQAIRANI
jgi:hypothetical protein